MTACQRGSIDVMPRIWSRVRPRMVSAAGFAVVISPWGFWKTIPSGSESKSRPLSGWRRRSSLGGS